MNIQFMTKEANGVASKHSYTGEPTIVYVPNFDELIANASCDEEVEMLEDTKARFESDNPLFEGFPFEIVYTVKTKSLDPYTWKWEEKWQLMQHPWVRTFDGVYASKEEMIEQIQNMYK